MREGTKVRLAGKGEPGRNGAPPGDLNVITRVAESPIFKRKGDNLEVDVPLTIPEAIRGAVRGRWVNVLVTDHVTAQRLLDEPV